MQAFPIDVATAESKDMVRRVFAAKRVPEAYLTRLGDQRELHRTDYPSVVANVSDASTLRGFDFYADYVTATFSALLA